MQAKRSIFIYQALASALAALPNLIMAQTPTTLNILWEVKVGNVDYMSTGNPTERDRFPVRGAFAYVPNSNIPFTLPFYRLSNGTSDHMDSTFNREANFNLEGILGYLWTSPTAAPGISQIVRLVSPADHATVRMGDAIPGYTSQENFGIFGYGRFNNSNLSLNSLSAGGVSIKSNSVAGGALWSWVWNGIEFIDTYDYGRQIQSAVFFLENGRNRNPNEAGSKYSAPPLQPYARQGSPVLNNQNQGNTQITRSIPLEWDPLSWSGDESHPVIYGDMQIGKDITLNYNNMGAVAQYKTVITVGNAVTGAVIEMPTGYMPPSFARFYTYDASTDSLTEVFPPSSCDNSNYGRKYIPPSGFGGVIISNADQTAAMAVYGKTSTVNVDFGVFDFRTCQDGGTTKWNAVAAANLPAGTTTFNSYITSGKLNEVKTNMRRLFLGGAN